MKVLSVFDPEFAAYGKVLKGLDTEALRAAVLKTPCPDGEVIYVASDPALEALPEMKLFSEQAYGGMPIQIGYCNGDNNILNCLEYHRDSEVNIPCGCDIIVLLGREEDIDFEDLTYDTSKVAAFRIPEGTVTEIYATTLHYAPCNAGGKFRNVVILPRDTNTALDFKTDGASERKLLFARNKWLIAHPEAPEAKQGAVAGLKGENIKL